MSDAIQQAIEQASGLWFEAMEALVMEFDGPANMRRLIPPRASWPPEAVSYEEIWRGDQKLGSVALSVKGNRLVVTTMMRKKGTEL